MSPLSRWIIGAHIFLAAWLLMGYTAWRQIIAPGREPKKIIPHLNLAVVCVLVLFLLHFSLNLMGNTYLIPRFGE